MGAETLIGTLGEKDMILMKITGDLMNSLKPGKTGRRGYAKSGKNQLVKYGRRKVQIGTHISYARMAQNKGTSSRKLWPDVLDVWYDRAIEKGRDAIAEELKSIGTNI